MEKQYNAEVNGKPIHDGEIVKDFRGQEWIFGYVLYPAHEHRSGKICVRDEFGRTRQFYDTVFPGLRIVEP